MSSYKHGVDAGRNGSDPSPPTYNQILDPIMAVSEKDVEQMASNYERGYQAGTQQRLADELANKNED